MARCSIQISDAAPARFIVRARKANVPRQQERIDATLTASRSSTRETSSTTTGASLGRFDLFTAPRPAYELVGLGEAMVDYSGMVNESYLDDKNIALGGRR